MNNTNALAAVLLTLAVLHPVDAGEVEILAADFQRSHSGNWSVNVTLKHADTGWDHYADQWRIVDREGKVIGDRVLYHPHVGEQPFTRGLSGVKLPEGVTNVYIEAHDKVHGWTPNRLSVDLGKANGGPVRVMAE